MSDLFSGDPLHDETCGIPSCRDKRLMGSGYCQNHKNKMQPKAAAAPRPGEMVCPHCQKKGTVSTKQVTTKQGISGGKATGAVLTAGFSLLATGLSRKQKVTEAHCRNCGATWHFA